MRMKGAQQRRGETAGRAEASARWNIGKRGDLDLRRAEVELSQRLADDPVTHRIDRLDMLDLGIFEVDARRERLDDRDVDVLVDRRRDEEPLMFAVVRRQVGSATAERDAQRAPHDDHFGDPA
jgi:hypothetical protein